VLVLLQVGSMSSAIRSVGRGVPSEIPSCFFFSIEAADRGRSCGPGARSGGQQHLLDDLGQRGGVALDRAGQRIAAQRAEAHARIIGTSPGFSGMRSSSTMISVPSRSTTGRSAAKYSGTIGMFSRWMYCQMSSSVQFEIGNTRMLSPLFLRRCRGARAPAAGSSGPSGAAPSGTRRCAPWRGSSPRRGARRRRPRRSRTCRAPASAPRSSTCRCAGRAVVERVDARSLASGF
jgi:hypothetical protein